MYLIFSFLFFFPLGILLFILLLSTLSNRNVVYLLIILEILGFFIITKWIFVLGFLVSSFLIVICCLVLEASLGLSLLVSLVRENGEVLL